MTEMISISRRIPSRRATANLSLVWIGFRNGSEPSRRGEVNSYWQRAAGSSSIIAAAAASDRGPILVRRVARFRRLFASISKRPIITFSLSDFSSPFFPPRPCFHSCSLFTFPFHFIFPPSPHHLHHLLFSSLRLVFSLKTSARLFLSTFQAYPNVFFLFLSFLFFIWHVTARKTRANSFGTQHKHAMCELTIEGKKKKKEKRKKRKNREERNKWKNKWKKRRVGRGSETKVK